MSIYHDYNERLPKLKETRKTMYSNESFDSFNYVQGKLTGNILIKTWTLDLKSVSVPNFFKPRETLNIFFPLTQLQK